MPEIWGEMLSYLAWSVLSRWKTLRFQSPSPSFYGYVKKRAWTRVAFHIPWPWYLGILKAWMMYGKSKLDRKDCNVHSWWSWLFLAATPHLASLGAERDPGRNRIHWGAKQPRKGGGICCGHNRSWSKKSCLSDSSFSKWPSVPLWNGAVLGMQGSLPRDTWLQFPALPLLPLLWF